MNSRAHRLQGVPRHGGVTIGRTAKRSVTAFVLAATFAIFAVPLSRLFWGVTIEQATAAVTVFMMLMYACLRLMFAAFSAIEPHEMSEKEKAALESEIARSSPMPRLMRIACTLLAAFMAIAIVTLASGLSLLSFWLLEFPWAFGPMVAVVRTLVYVLGGVFITALILILCSKHDAHGRISKQIRMAMCMLDGLHTRLAHSRVFFF